MIKTRWVRNAAIFGTAVTLSLACASTANEGLAAGFCQEKEMAGLSLSLDKFYTENYAVTQNTSDTTEAATATPAPAPTEAENPA